MMSLNSTGVDDNFYIACESGDINTVKRLIPDLVDIDKKNSKGWSGLIMAAFNGHVDIVSVLIDNGANVNDKNYNGTTVFMYAKDSVLRTKDYRILDLLIERGADINARDNKGLSALDYIKKNKYIDLIDYMLSKKAQ
ncbi:MAG: ankyrin repeat domain-containing protein [Bacteroidota bacterium]